MLDTSLLRAAENPLDALRRRVRALEAHGGSEGPGPVMAPFGVPALDAALAGGVTAAALHEVIGDPGPVLAWIGLMLDRLARVRESGGGILWVGRAPELYGPGLGALGLDRDRLLWARAARPADRWWAMEEGLRTPGLAAVVGEAATPDLTAGRRLQLAAAAGRVTGFLACLLAPGEPTPAGHGAAVTRWHIRAAPSVEIDRLVGPPRWRVELVRARGGVPGAWLMEGDDATRSVRVVSDSVDRSFGAPQTGRPAQGGPADLPWRGRLAG